MSSQKGYKSKTTDAVDIKPLNSPGETSDDSIWFFMSIWKEGLPSNHEKGTCKDLIYLPENKTRGSRGWECVCGLVLWSCSQAGADDHASSTIHFQIVTRSGFESAFYNKGILLSRLSLLEEKTYMRESWARPAKPVVHVCDLAQLAWAMRAVYRVHLIAGSRSEQLPKKCPAIVSFL
jgi:hypothetical protein